MWIRWLFIEDLAGVFKMFFAMKKAVLATALEEGAEACLEEQ